MCKYVLSVDLGGTNVRVGIVSENCEIIAVNRENTIKNDRFALGNQICRMIENLPYKNYGVKYVGISAAGFVNKSIIEYSPNNGLKDFNLKTFIEERFPDLSVEVKNDANATTLSESEFGASKDYENSFFVTISSGVGGGLVVNKKMIDLPFEVGHMYMDYKGQPVETEKILSGNGIKFLCNDNDLPVKDAAEFFDLIRQHDYKSMELLNYWIDKTSQFLANIQLCYNCECIVLSGGVMKSSDLFYTPLKNKFESYIERFPIKQPVLRLAKFDQDAGLMGGAAVALSNLK